MEHTLKRPPWQKRYQRRRTLHCYLSHASAISWPVVKCCIGRLGAAGWPYKTKATLQRFVSSFTSHLKHCSPSTSSAVICTAVPALCWAQAEGRVHQAFLWFILSPLLTFEIKQIFPMVSGQRLKGSPWLLGAGARAYADGPCLRGPIEAELPDLSSALEGPKPTLADVDQSLVSHVVR